MQNEKKPLILHPILAGSYPVLALLAHNIDEMPLQDALRALGISASAAVILVVLFRPVLRNWYKAAIVSTLGVTLFFSYGHVHSSLNEPIRLFGLTLNNHRYLLPITVCLFAVGVWLAAKRLRNAASLTSALNVISVVLLAFPVYQLVSFQLQLASTETQTTAALAEDGQALRAANKAMPDIYLFVLDTYPRADLLLEDYGYDNTPFLDDLEELGFYVAECSQSNYSFTRLSLTTMLNLEYLDTLLPELDRSITDKSVLNPLLQGNAVRRKLEALGYVVVAFQTDFSATEFSDAEYFFVPKREQVNFSDGTTRPEEGTADYYEVTLGQTPLGRILVNMDLNKFEWLLVQTSAARLAPDLAARTVDNSGPDQEYLDRLRQYNLLHFVLDKLDEVPEIEGPKFVFAHIVAPHGPFVLSPDGSLSAPNVDPGKGFTDQVEYLNRRLLPLFERIIDEAETPPIIILQGDHGPNMKNEPGFAYTDILNAYYLPGDGDASLYPTITPVNSFRVIFSYYYGAAYPLLEDRSFTSNYNAAPFILTELPNDRSDCNLRYP
jgi:hypothetical protein